MGENSEAQARPGAEDSLFGQLRPLLWAVAVRRMRDPTLAADLTHAALEQTLRAVRERRIDDPERVAPYALATLRNLAADEVRTRRRREQLLAQHVPEPLDDALPTLDRERLFGCFHRLEYRARLVIVGTFFEDRTTAAIASELGVMEGNLRVLRHRALARLRACMEGP